MADKRLYIVHCIDTEGPLYESLEATFERLEKILGFKLEPSQETLDQLRRKELDLGGREEIASLVVSEPLLHYNDTWDKLDAMLDDMLSEAYRFKYADAWGEPWIYNWFIVDHVGYEVNPRRRDIGYHNIFDHYRRRLKSLPVPRDEVHWHFHPMSTYKEAHICATSFLRSPHLLETLSRRIIDRGWFPSCFRPGFHAERPDSHWFLEQWVPFDFSNQAIPPNPADAQQDDIAGGRLGDWRRAPNDWSPYHPSHDDYQVPGGCRRAIFRCLNVGTRLRLLDRREVARAFARADQGHPTVLAFTNHDFRDMRHDVAATHELMTEVARDYPEVAWQHAGAREAARASLGLESPPPVKLELTFESRADALHMNVSSSAESFGPQPFLAVKTKDKRYLTDNFDLHVPKRRWSYTFDNDTVPPNAIETIGVATNSADGATCVVNYTLEDQRLEEHST